MMTEVKLYHQDGTLLEKIPVKKLAPFILYRGFLYMVMTGNNPDKYVQVQYVEVG